MDSKSLEFLALIFSIDKFAKPNQNPTGFSELCDFAENLGYTKIQETKEGVVYQDKNDKFVIPFPQNYAPLNKK
jgi:hypothetical protein